MPDLGKRSHSQGEVVLAYSCLILLAIPVVCKAGRKGSCGWFDFRVSFQPPLAYVLHDKRNMGAFAFVLALSFLQNFPSHKLKYFSNSEDYSPLSSSCSRLLGKSRYRRKQKAGKKPVFLLLDVCVTIILCYCFYPSK